jgi:protocatechuate 3,4-dioxygenase beta subunit
VLAQNATFEGTVLNSTTRAGIAEARVTLWTQRGVRYNAITNASGAFRIAGVEPGEYNERYEKSGFEQLDRPGFGQPPIRIGTAGSLHTDVQLAPFATLRGRVLDPEGKPAADVAVSLGWHDPTRSDAGGHFEMDQLRAGTYWLLASPLDEPSPTSSDHTHLIPTYYPSTPNLTEAERIQVRPGADLAGYEIHLRTSRVYGVSGIVLDETGKPVPKANVRLLRPGEDRLLAGRSSFRLPVGIVQHFLNFGRIQNQEGARPSRDDGTFEFRSVRPGDWSLQAELTGKHDTENNLYLATSNIVRATVSDRDIKEVELRFQADFTVEVTADWEGRPPKAGSRVPHVTLVPSTPGRVEEFNRKPQDEVERFGHLLPGRYQIVPTPGLPPGFYPTAVIVADQNVLGQEIELTPGMPPIRVVYKPDPGTVRGTVEPGQEATVILWPQGAAIPGIVRAAQTDSRGSFEVANVPPGDYSVVAFDRVSNEGGSESFVLGVVAAAPRVKVSEARAETVQIPLARWPD